MSNQLTANTAALEELLATASALPAAITIDDTLTQSGQAADAKVTGTLIAEKAPIIHADQHRISNTLSWDGDETGRTVVAEHFVHVSDVVPAFEDILAKATYLFEEDGETESTAVGTHEYFEASDEYVWVMSEIAFVANDNVEIPSYGTFPKKGIYFGYFKQNEEFVWRVSGVTVPGYNIGNATDPITHDMIGAAPAVHADQHRNSDTITWDGDTTGKTTVVESDEYGTYTYCHMSDVVLTPSDVVGKAISTETSIDGNSECYALDEWSFNYYGDGFFAAGLCVFVPKDDILFGDITFPKKGIYFCHTDEEGDIYYPSSLTVPGIGFADSSDPIKPDMISAAPRSHAMRHQTSDTLVWDWDFANRLIVFAENGTSCFAHMSDIVPSWNEVINHAFFTNYATSPTLITEDLSEKLTESVNCYAGVYVVSQENAVVDGVTFPKKGIYFLIGIEDGTGFHPIVTTFTIPGRNFATLSGMADELSPAIIGAPDLGTMAEVINTINTVQEELGNIEASTNEHATQISALQEEALMKSDKQSIVNDALGLLETANSYPDAAFQAQTRGRLGTLEAQWGDLDGRISALNTVLDNQMNRVDNHALAIESLQKVVDELGDYLVDYITKIVMRLVQLERNAGLQPPVSDSMDTNIGIENQYDRLFGQA